jgi:hypothetical protein
MEDPGIIRLNLDHYRRRLSLSLDDVTRQKTLTLIAEAEAELAARANNDAERPHQTATEG